MRKICVFTDTRAEYGILKPLLDEIKNNSELTLQLLVSGMHLSHEFGMTIDAIKMDGFEIDERIETLLSSDTQIGTAKSVGLGLISYSEAIARLNPDICVVLGDRFEVVAFALSCYILRVPIAHLHGGETGEGCMDEAFRHSITKYSHIHFASTESHRKRIIQLGENPKSVFNVGALGIDNIKNLKLLEKNELEVELGIKFAKRNILFTYHPILLDSLDIYAQMGEIFGTLDEMKDIFVVFTKSNADGEGRVINEMIDEYCRKNPSKAKFFDSLGQLRYLSLAKAVDVVMGNSSSGVIEIPSLKTATLDIGDRQKGRTRAESVVNCEPTKEAILEAFDKIFSKEFQEMLDGVENPYGNGGTAEKICKVIKEYPLSGILKKEFYDIGFEIAK